MSRSLLAAIKAQKRLKLQLARLKFLDLRVDAGQLL